jgi:uncharacterized protein (TIGR03118 family)
VFPVLADLAQVKGGTPMYFSLLARPRLLAAAIAVPLLLMLPVDAGAQGGKSYQQENLVSDLDSPWGLTLAPANFGMFSHAVLVGNFGDGRVNAFNALTGAFLGHHRSGNGNAISINGLWGLAFGNGGLAGNPNTLFFTAGFNDEDGLFGTIVAE